jgi:hypothetical protein
LEGFDGTDVGEEGEGASSVVPDTVLLVLGAGNFIRIFAESGDAVSRDEFASGVTSTTIGIAEGRARLVVADRFGGVGSVFEPLAENLGVALVLVVDCRAA